MARDPDSWWLDERVHAGREHFDEQHARRYDAKMDAQAAEEVCLLQEAGALGRTSRRRLQHVRDEHSTYTWLLEPMIERAGFDVIDANYSASGVFVRYLCSKR